MKPTNRIKQTAKTTGILLAGLLLGWLLFGGGDSPATLEEHIEQSHTDAQGEIVYTCSMHPSVRESEPGNCPICGMELVPLNDTGTSSGEDPYRLEMTEAAVKLAEVQTSTVRLETPVQTVRMPGKITVDERRIRSLPAHFPGRIEQLYVNFTGEFIERGERVASVYSPELVSAQKELLESYGRREQNPVLYRAARTKLQNWNIPESQIDQIESSGEVRNSFDIVSHMEGYVIRRNISVGDHVEMGTVMYRMADLSSLWAVFNAYEQDLDALNVGDRITYTVDALPGRSFEADITYIDPVLDPQSRTLRVRAEVENPDGKLKPQMLAEGMVSSRIADGGLQLTVPRSAVLWTGERSVVYVRVPGTEQPTFEFREVVLGRRAGDRFVVHFGLHEGEEVVTNGNFKIDSAAQLAGKVSMMNREPQEGATPLMHDHGDTDM